MNFNIEYWRIINLKNKLKLDGLRTFGGNQAYGIQIYLANYCKNVN